MGTRADFYIGTGAKAQWLGSVAWDGYEWDARDNDGVPCPLMEAKTEEEFLIAVKEISQNRRDWTSPEQGWPWPWETSATTDYAYMFENGRVNVFCFGGLLKGCPNEFSFPDMTERMNVTFGERSGLIIVSG